MLEQNNHWKLCMYVCAVFLDNYAQNLASKKPAQKPRKIWAVYLEKPLKTAQILRGF